MDRGQTSDPYVKTHLLPGASKVSMLPLFTLILCKTLKSPSESMKFDPVLGFYWVKILDANTFFIGDLEATFSFFWKFTHFSPFTSVLTHSPLSETPLYLTEVKFFDP